ncbi:MAG: hypothetical protein DBY37_03220 [Desulfovibrionaceae bacterium]|nr:MAG: hypothetical protein DBY37_03220 [Desulfovibrionaceae bacterium]
MHNNRTTESLLARRALAEKATPGPWANNDNVERLFGRKPHDWWVVYADFCGIKGAQILQCSMYGATEAEQIESRKKEKMCDPGISGCNAAHIAANDPSTVIADIDEILRLRAEVEFWRQETQDVRENFERILQCERDKTDRLEKEADWLISEKIVEEWNGRFVGAFNADKGGLVVYESQAVAVASWREAARKAVEKVK